MLRRSLRVLQSTYFGAAGETGTPGKKSEVNVPFYSKQGNLYSRHPRDPGPDPMVPNSSQTPYLHDAANQIDENPVVQAAIEKCPYFALCDMAIYQKLDVSYLDPGVLSTEEHILLLLFSRGYFEKWREIHSHFRYGDLRFKRTRGRDQLFHRIMDMCQVSDKIRNDIITDGYDDTWLVATSPALWDTAHLTPRMRMKFSGRIFAKHGMSKDQQDLAFRTLDRMRSFNLLRKDMVRETIYAPEDEAVMQTMLYKDAPTAYDLYTALGMEPYSGQLRLKNYFGDPSGHPANMKGVRRDISIKSEDDYFDFLFHSFMFANLDILDYEGPPSRYVMVAEKSDQLLEKTGRWF